jgi:hypothetical protein
MAERPSYRTFNRMERRRDFVRDELAGPAAADEAAAIPAYAAELETLSQLRAEGLISEEEFATKRKQALGL